MKTLALISLTFLSIYATSSAQALSGTSVADPVAHFRSVYEMSIVKKIYRLEVDLDNDGKKEILIGHKDEDPDTHQLTDEGEIGWWVYIAKPNGQYTLVGQKTDDGLVTDGAAGFSKNQYWVGLIPELNRYGLLHLSCGRGGQAKCQLKAIVLEGDAFKEIAIGQPVSAETNAEQLAQRFTNPPTPAVQELAP